MLILCVDQTKRAKELISRGRKLGRVLHVSEAFRMYPTEEEVREEKQEYRTTENTPDEL